MLYLSALLDIISGVITAAAALCLFDYVYIYFLCVCVCTGFLGLIVFNGHRCRWMDYWVFEEGPTQNPSYYLLIFRPIKETRLDGLGLILDFVACDISSLSLFRFKVM